MQRPYGRAEISVAGAQGEMKPSGIGRGRMVQLVGVCEDLGALMKRVETHPNIKKRADLRDLNFFEILKNILQPARIYPVNKPSCSHKNVHCTSVCDIFKM